MRICKLWLAQKKKEKQEKALAEIRSKLAFVSDSELRQNVGYAFDRMNYNRLCYSLNLMSAAEYDKNFDRDCELITILYRELDTRAKEKRR